MIRRKSHVLIGIDESGTGAFASIATCCAFAVLDTQHEALARAGAKDSKAIQTKERRAIAMDSLLPYSLLSCVEEMPVAALDKDHKGAWREAIANAAQHVIEQLKHEYTLEVIIDGNKDNALAGYFERVLQIVPRFEPKADAKYAVVGAASICAKVTRSRHMEVLAKKYPAYHFDKNDGYGTEDHMKVIQYLGVTPEHRRVKPLLEFFHEKSDLDACASVRRSSEG